MTDLYIIGTGGGAKEIIQLIEQINQREDRFTIKGFIVLDAANNRIKILGNDYELYEEDDFLKQFDHAAIIISNGFPGQRESIYSKFKDYEFPNLVHPNIDLHSSVIIGRGNTVFHRHVRKLF